MTSRLFKIRIKKKVRRLKISLLVLAALSTWYTAERLNLNPVQSAGAPTFEVVEIEKQVEVVKEVEVDRTFTSEKQQILAYIVEKFGERADDAIAMVNQCENSSFKTDAMNFNVQQNGRRSYDVGIFQINVDEGNTEEIERLKNWKYNVDRAYDKYHSKGDTFYHWTCGYVVKDRTYLDAIRGQ